MIQSHINSTRNYGVVLNFKRLSHLSDWSFGLVSPVISAFIGSRFVAGKDYLEEDYLMPEKGSEVKAIQSVIAFTLCG